MSDVLAEICADKRADVAGRKTARPAAELRARSPKRRRRAASRGAGAAGAAGRYGLIAEIKKASPEPRA